jgi:hypothetical protein
MPVTPVAGAEGNGKNELFQNPMLYRNDVVLSAVVVCFIGSVPGAVSDRW